MIGLRLESFLSKTQTSGDNHPLGHVSRGGNGTYLRNQKVRGLFLARNLYF